MNVYVFFRIFEFIEIVFKVVLFIFFFMVDKEKVDLKGYMFLFDVEKSVFYV